MDERSGVEPLAYQRGYGRRCTELLIILLVVLFVFGLARLPMFARYARRAPIPPCDLVFCACPLRSGVACWLD